MAAIRVGETAMATCRGGGGSVLEVGGGSARRREVATEVGVLAAEPRWGTKPLMVFWSLYSSFNAH